MKVVRVRWRGYRVPFKSPYVTSLGTATDREGLIVELTTDDGFVGLGEAVLMPEVRGALNRLGNMTERLTPLLKDEDVSDDLEFEVKGDAGQAMAAAIDCAMLDLVAQSRGVSLARLLAAEGVSLAPHVAVNALLSQPDLSDLRAAATAARAAGYTTVKLKVGMAADVAGEVERVAAVREAIGPDAKLRIDPNGTWSVDRAIETLRALRPFAVDYVEQPIDEGSIDDLKRVQVDAGTDVAADEDVADLFEAFRILSTGSARVLVLKPSRLGGQRNTRDIIEAAQRAGVRSVVTTSIETGIGTAACLQLAALAPGEAHGLSTLTLLEDDLIEDAGLTVEAGLMRLPETPGLGVRLDHAALDRYAVGAWREA